MRWHRKSPASRLFTQPFRHIKVPCHWPLCREFIGDRWIPHTNCQSLGKFGDVIMNHLVTSSWIAWFDHRIIYLTGRRFHNSSAQFPPYFEEKKWSTTRFITIKSVDIIAQIAMASNLHGLHLKLICYMTTWMAIITGWDNGILADDIQQLLEATLTCLKIFHASQMNTFEHHMSSILWWFMYNILCYCQYVSTFGETKSIVKLTTYFVGCGRAKYLYLRLIHTYRESPKISFAIYLHLLGKR